MPSKIMLGRGQACTECRRRKLKCDGHKPYCTICALAERECRYEAPSTKPVSVHLQEQVEKLERKLQKLTDGAPSPSQSTASCSSESPSVSIASSSPAIVVPPVPPPDLAPGWWEAGEIDPRAKDYLISLFEQNQWNGLFLLHMPTFKARLAASDPKDHPHPALLEPMYLFACYFSARLPPSDSLAHLEDVFLERAQKALDWSLSWSDRLMDFMRGSVLVAGYLFVKGRYLQGYYAYCGAARFAMSCGLHRIRSSQYHPSMSIPTPLSLSVIPPPRNGIDLGERVITFWMVYTLDKMYSIVAGFASALPSPTNLDDGIETVLPREMCDYEKGIIENANETTLQDLFEETDTEALPHPCLAVSPWGTTLQALALLDRATLLIRNPAQPSTTENQASLRSLEETCNKLFSNLPSVPLTTTSVMTLGETSVVIARTTVLGALIEIYGGIEDEDYDAYDKRVACATSVAELVTNLPKNLVSNGSLLGAAYCWSLAAQVLLQHIRANGENADIVEEFHPQLAHVVDALKNFSKTFPKLTSQYGVVQITYDQAANEPPSV